ncbi:hypothetical protein F4808DRAFT_22729 [Astrocystis sublimbata]|nr:hypothetical protein F4808DRAFT_22729 [Astrocystis sublimbata]
MDAAEGLPCGSVSGGIPGGNVAGVSDDAAGGGDGPSTSSKASHNPQATVPGGLNPLLGLSGASQLPQSLQTPQPFQPSQSLTALPASTLPSSVPAPVPAPVLAPVPRPSSRNCSPSPFLRGPVPQKGSGQDRFLQLLKGSDQSGLPDFTSIAVPTNLVHRPTEAQTYALATPADTTAKTTAAVKTERKGGSWFLPKPAIGNAHGQAGRPTAGGPPNGHIPLATQRLSTQCQLRHFNPKWFESQGPTGFLCSVQIMNKLINGGTVYPTAYEAKQAVAEKALVHVRQIPCDDPAEKAEKAAARLMSAGKTDRFSESNRLGRPQVKRESPAKANNGSSQSQYVNAALADANVAAHAWNAYSHAYPPAASHEQGTSLIDRITSAFGGAGPSPAVLADPLAAQAFLQGLAVGTSVRVASSVYEPYIESRSRPLPVVPGETYRPYEARERSPQPSISRNYRDRSPPRQRPTYEPNTRRSG